MLHWAMVALNKQAPGSGLPNNCLLLLSIDLATFCDSYSSRRPHLKPQLLVLGSLQRIGYNGLRFITRMLWISRKLAKSIDNNNGQSFGDP